MSEVPLREYLEGRIEELEKRLQESRRFDQEALRLQAREYERRLTALNGEHARIDKIVQEKVSREEWDDYHQVQLRADYVTRVEFVSHLSEALGRTKAFAIGYSTIPTIIAIAGLLVAMFFHKG